jgi:superfamily I DNA and/or RNA helicase
MLWRFSFMYLFILFSIGIQGPRCVLAGDHLQLPPTIQSVEAEKKGMGKTLFERLTEGYGEEITSMLTVQYRMHELIMNWSSKELYNNKVHFSLYYCATC